jgi:hypothetical protein
MKTTTLLLALAAFATGVYAGAPAPMMPTGPAPTMETLFGPGWEAGAHALYLTPQARRASDAWGGGVDVDYFFDPYVGLEATAAWASPHSSQTNESHGTWGNYTLDFEIRAPFEAYHIAPYILAGGGMISAKGDIDGNRVNKWLGQLGAGLEYKPCAKFGLFADWIYNFPGASHEVPNYQEIRLGVKFGF